MTGSLAYRKNEREILKGKVPAKYTRLLPHIPMGRILELGSAEGVLAQLLAQRGDTVTGLERSRERHEAALRLREKWGTNAELVCGDITNRYDLLAEKDVLVAVRMIYYLRERTDEVFAEIADKVPNVVLCGNKNRAAEYHKGIPDKRGGPIQKYASKDGMVSLLKRHGYQIVEEITEGDPIVVGKWF